MPWSIASPPASRNTACKAVRGLGARPTTFFAMASAREPDTRNTPMPPRPAGVATAAIVSRVSSSLGMGRLVAIEHALDLPLLGDGENVVDEPVEHKARGKEEEEDAEDERHDLHHARLHRIRWHRVHRSEERRVGKEGRSRWGTADE